MENSYGTVVLEFMKQIGIFMFCAQSLLHFTAGRAYEKYMRVLIGMMLLAQFTAPVRAALTDGASGQLWEEVERFQTELNQMMREAEEEAEDMGTLTRERQEKAKQETAGGRIERVEIEKTEIERIEIGEIGNGGR